MAVIKHISSKNANYSAAELYLTFQHDEETGKPLLDEHGHYIPRPEYLISGILCSPDLFAVECVKANLRYKQNQKKGDIKSHHYIISFDPRDQEDHGLTLEEVQRMGEEFCPPTSPAIRRWCAPTRTDITVPGICTVTLSSTLCGFRTWSASPTWTVPATAEPVPSTAVPGSSCAGSVKK